MIPWSSSEKKSKNGSPKFCLLSLFFVRIFASRLTDKLLRQNVLEEFKAYVKTAFSEIVMDMAQDKINSLKNKLTVEIDQNQEEKEVIEDSGIETTEDELQGFFIVKSNN